MNNFRTPPEQEKPRTERLMLERKKRHLEEEDKFKKKKKDIDSNNK